MNELEGHLESDLEVLLDSVYLPNLVLPKVDPDETLLLGLRLELLVHRNHLSQMLLRLQRVLNRLNQHHIEGDVSDGLL